MATVFVRLPEVSGRAALPETEQPIETVEQHQDE